MPWTKFGDEHLDDPDVLSVTVLAELLYMRMRIYIEKHGTQGVVPTHVIEPLLRGGLAKFRYVDRRAIRADELVNELIVSGLCERHPQGVLIVGWERWTGTVRDPAERQAAQRRGGLKSAEVRRLKYGTAQPLEVNAEVTTSSNFETETSRSAEVTTSEVSRTPRDGTGRDGSGKTPGAEMSADRRRLGPDGRPSVLKDDYLP
jgi:hypothetical protein